MNEVATAEHLALKVLEIDMVSSSVVEWVKMGAEASKGITLEVGGLGLWEAPEVHPIDWPYIHGVTTALSQWPLLPRKRERDGLESFWLHGDSRALSLEECEQVLAALRPISGLLGSVRCLRLDSFSLPNHSLMKVINCFPGISELQIVGEVRYQELRGLVTAVAFPRLHYLMFSVQDNLPVDFLAALHCALLRGTTFKLDLVIPREDTRNTAREILKQFTVQLEAVQEYHGFEKGTCPLQVDVDAIDFRPGV